MLRSPRLILPPRGVRGQPIRDGLAIRHSLGVGLHLQSPCVRCHLWPAPLLALLLLPPLPCLHMRVMLGWPPPQRAGLVTRLILWRPPPLLTDRAQLDLRLFTE